MRRQLRLVAILATCLIAYGLVIQAFHWMNLASDRIGLRRAKSRG